MYTQSIFLFSLVPPDLAYFLEKGLLVDTIFLEFSFLDDLLGFLNDFAAVLLLLLGYFIRFLDDFFRDLFGISLWYLNIHLIV